MKQSILIVDDEPRIQRFIRANLRAAGYEVLLASTGGEAIAACEQQEPDLLLLDLGLPDIDGLEVFQRIRRFSRLPVIILTARSASSDKVQGLDLGADDYIIKPFDVDELVARVRAVLRRTANGPASPAPSSLTIGPLCIDVAAHEIRLEGEPVHFTPTEFKLLAYLAAHVDKVVLHEELLTHVWGPAYRDALEYLRVTIARIRQKLGDHPARHQLQTIPGVGYKLSRR
ncbi:MAG: response regulator transcription factor [Bacillota bacterium]